MDENASKNTFVPFDRPIRAAFVGLGRVYDLNVRGYLNNPDVDVVALIDPNPDRLAERQADWPSAQCFSSIDELTSSELAVDAVEVLLPISLHEEGAIAVSHQRMARQPTKALRQRPGQRAANTRRGGAKPARAARDGELSLL